MWQKTLFYLGLVDEDEAPAYESSARAHAEHPYQDQEAASPQRRMTPDPRTGRRTLQTQTPGGEMEHRDPIGAGVSGRRVEPPLTTRRRMPADNALAEAGVIVRGTDTPSVRTLSDADLQTEIIVARSYSDAQALADHIRSAVPVVLDLRKVEPAMVRRLVDFSSGLTYALGGSMRKVGQGVILVTPANVNITRDERARLSDMGYYQGSED